MSSVVTVSLVEPQENAYIDRIELVGIFTDEYAAMKWIDLYGDNAKSGYLFSLTAQFRIEYWSVFTEIEVENLGD